MAPAAAAGWGPSADVAPGEGEADRNASTVWEAFPSASPALGVAVVGGQQVLGGAVGFVAEPAAAEGEITEVVSPGMADRVS